MGKLSDRVGRKKVIAGAAIAMAIAGVPCYVLIVTGNVALAILGACVMAFIFAGHTGVIHILIVELFPTRVRYSAYGLGYNISSALFGGTAPLLMTLLIAQTGNLHARLLRRHHRARHARRGEHGQGQGPPAAARHPPRTHSGSDTHVLQRLQDRPRDRRLHRHGRRHHRDADQARPRGPRLARDADRLDEVGRPHRHDARTPSTSPTPPRSPRRSTGLTIDVLVNNAGRLGAPATSSTADESRSTSRSTSTCGRCCTCAGC